MSSVEVIGHSLGNGGLSRSRNSVKPEDPTLRVPFGRQSLAGLRNLSVEPVIYGIEGLSPGALRA